VEANPVQMPVAELGSGSSIREGTGWRWLPVALGVIVLDQLVKAWMVANLKPYEPHHVLPVLDITLMFNTGAAFSFLDRGPGWQVWGFTVLAVAVSVGILIWLRKVGSRTQRLLALALTLILGGALGNVIDRIRIGHVVDFIFPHWNNHWFPAFNLADSAITIGAILLAWDALMEGRAAKRAAK
jgi:signal peptidase II